MFQPRSRWTVGLWAGACLAACGPVLATHGASQHPESLIHHVNARASFVITGNSFGLAGELDANGPGTADSNHTLITLDMGSVDNVPPNPSNPWPPRTTHDWTQNSSGAFVSLPDGSTVIRAQLFWGGSYRYVEDVSSFIDGDVELSTPLGTYPVSPDPLFSVTLDLTAGGGYQVAYYLRSANVTSQVSAGGSGFYALGSVPATQHENVNTLNGAGWTLVVVVAEETWSCRTLALATSGAWVEEGTSSTALLSGFAAPGIGDVEGRLITGAIDGDANRTGDGVGVRDPGAPAYLPLSGPNNPETNFFASQINTEDGLLDTTGTWGTANHSATASTNTSGGRQGWDQTGIQLSSMAGTLANNQTGIEVRHQTTGDAYVVTFVGVEVDADPALCPTEIPIFADDFESGTTSAWSSTNP